MAVQTQSCISSTDSGTRISPGSTTDPARLASTLSIPSSSESAFPLRKVEILEKLDRARTQWYHFTTILVAGCGFFTDAYDLFSISIVSKLLGRIYYYDPANPTSPGQLPFNIKIAVSATALCGTFLGALLFGIMGDKFGRRKVYGMTLVLMIVCSIGSGLSFGKDATYVITTLCFFRFWLGFGIGGDYPLSATIMSEYSNVRSRGCFIAAVFAMQGFGILFGATIGIIVSATFNHYNPSPSFSADPVRSTPERSDIVWRVILMFGALPAILTLYFRLRLPETARFTALVEGDILKATTDMEMILEEGTSMIKPKTGRWVTRKSEIFSEEFRKRFGRQILGTCSAWFLLDVTFYSQNLFQDDVLADVGWLPASESMSAVKEVFMVSRSQAFIALCATVPGYWVAVATVEKLGRRMIQLQGFFFMFVFTLIVGASFYKLRGDQENSTGAYSGGNHLLFLILYAVIFFFCNFGPNTTTFIVPAELFPTTLRSTCFGVSAAAGKVGAVVGSFGFLYAKQNKIGPRGAFLMLAFLNVLGFLATFFCTPETKGKSLEELSGDFDSEKMTELEPLSDNASSL